MTEARLTPKGQKILLDNIARSNLVIVQVEKLIGAVINCCWNIPISNAGSVRCAQCQNPVLDIEGYTIKSAPAQELVFLSCEEDIQKQVAMFRFALSRTLHILPSDILLTVSFD